MKILTNHLRILNDRRFGIGDNNYEKLNSYIGRGRIQMVCRHIYDELRIVIKICNDLLHHGNTQCRFITSPLHRLLIGGDQ